MAHDNDYESDRQNDLDNLPGAHGAPSLADMDRIALRAMA